MGENVPALFCLDASNPEKMITAGFIDIQNGRWVKLLTETEFKEVLNLIEQKYMYCLLYTSPSPRDCS